LAPPSVRPNGDEVELASEPESGSTSGGLAGRLFVFAILLVGVAAALYFWMDARERRARRLASQHEAEVAVVPEPPISRSDVVVQTDVEGAELLVDGRSQGTASSDAGWTLELVPGLHQLQARVGGEAGSINASSSVTVVEGKSASVFLSLPAGTSFGEDASVPNTVQPSAKRAEKAEHRRHRRERGTEAVDVYVPPDPAAPKASP
ncbi:MAG TPA: hypothetical protein VFX59_20405, partial [Polyangiales bacterium]|nr:hypothetical protein [Polyangiales bacterium]